MLQQELPILKQYHFILVKTSQSVGEGGDRAGNDQTKRVHDNTEVGTAFSYRPVRMSNLDKSYTSIQIQKMQNKIKTVLK